MILVHNYGYIKPLIMNKLFDIACNFTSNRFDEDLDKVIVNAIDKNVDKFLLVSAEMGDINRILDINNLYPNNCYFTSGVHPHHANDFFDESPSILDKLVTEHNPNAIGETGLDFFRNISSYNNQVYAFEEQIKIAIKHNKPLFLHQRDSHRDFINVLNKYKNYLPKCVVHCFTGSRDELNEYLNSGFYVGLTGWICDERRNQVLRETIKDIPLERLMIETDCPYLIPRNIKVKGNRNEPSFLPHIASEIASLMRVDEKVLIKQTYENAINFFN